MRAPVDPFFIPDLCNPATLHDSGQDDREILVIYTPPDGVTDLGGIPYENGMPRALARDVDVQFSTHQSTMDLHAFIEDENGNVLVDEDGRLLVSEKEELFYLTQIHPDGTGVTNLELSKEATS